MAKGDILERSNPVAEIRLLKDTLGRIWNLAGTQDAEGDPRPKDSLTAEEIREIWNAALGGMSVHTDDGRDDSHTVPEAVESHTYSVSEDGPERAFFRGVGKKGE